jgi:hypothetical protein
VRTRKTASRDAGARATPTAWLRAIVLVLVTALATSARASHEIALTRDGGVYTVSVTINSWLLRSFIVDSGAADVQVSADVFLLLYPRGAPPPGFLPGGAYRLADGRVFQSRRFLIGSLRIGDLEFPDVAASIGEAGAPLLLGQNVLSRLGAWSIDNRRGVLVLGESGTKGSGPPACLSWQTAPDTCAVAGARDHFQNTRPRHDVKSIVLLASAGDRATVLVDVLRRDDGRAPARLCGLMQLRRAGTGWRLAEAPALRQIGSDDRCLP